MKSDMQSFAMTVAYDGYGFSGFARQPGQRTVQGEIETALETLARMPLAVTGAGRTDAGVHALGQVVSFDAPAGVLEPHTLLKSVNALCGPDVAVTEVRKAPPGFSARFDAEAREYRYRIVPGPVPPVFLARYAWWVKRTLDIGAMRTASSALIGEHDFRSFCVSASAEGKSTVRALELVDLTPDTLLGEHCLTVRIVGSAFLHSMVRVIVGSLVEVGTGRRDPAWLADVLAACDRAAAGQTAPPHGLTLWHVSYPEECWL